MNLALESYVDSYNVGGDKMKIMGGSLMMVLKFQCEAC